MKPLISSKNIKELRRQCRHLNIFPIDLPNHYRYPKKNIITELLQALVPECIDKLQQKNTDELKKLIDGFPGYYRHVLKYDEYTELYDVNHLERVALYYLSFITEENYFDLRAAISPPPSENIVFEQYPELIKQIDNDGLLIINDLMQLHDGGILYKDHILHYHQFLRRGFTSHPNFDFLGRFLSYHSKSRSINCFRIAIDSTRLMPKDFYAQRFEYDAWFGPDFHLDELDNRNSTGLTIKKRIKPSPFDLTIKLDRTEFFWSFRDPIKTLEIEEVSDLSFKFDTYNINRYIHSERDIHKNIFRHFDGAVKIYQSNYQQRFETFLPNETKSEKYVKLFRIDGNIEIDAWLKLIAYFFRGNEMILEYFDPKKFSQEFGQTIENYRSRFQDNEANN